MSTNEIYINRCIELAKLGAGSASPNPMVGSVIVCNDEVIGEGYHKKHGEAHAEVNAINSVKNTELLEKSTIYVSLEPCAHFGLTPPCSDLIIQKKIPRVVIGTIDPFAKVAGKGIEKLGKAGIEVIVGVLEKECQELNKRFFTFHEEKRPYIILKWAQTLDGFIDVERTEKEFGEPTWITGKKALHRVHEIRAIEDAILVGTNTALKDNPSLTVRHCEGRNPVRIVLDNQLRLPERLNLLDGSTKTIVFNSLENKYLNNTSYVKIDFNKEIIEQILKELYQRNILSLIIEGGKRVLRSFISENLWDEAHLFIGNKYFYNGIRSPQIEGKIVSEERIDDDKLIVYKNN
jgi:diaminohydroxyphosphoribosylaminopyrimidine deaminase/5-amino-6-(5-phosphoribosylamino)uracil reductase